MAASCSPPKKPVRSYLRARPDKRKRKRAAPAKYYEARNHAGHSCGHHHKTMSAAIACSRRMDSKARRTGRKPSYEAEKVG